MKDIFEKHMQLAIKAFKGRSYSQAEENIKQAMLINPHSPIVHNLYGILEELLLDDDLARKHYRAAYALDPTYKPAIRNLERITAFDSLRSKENFDYGDQPEDKTESLYIIAYDETKVGRLCRKGKE